jgi:hypothetical protein
MNKQIQVHHQVVVVVVHQNLIELILYHLFHQLSKYFNAKILFKSSYFFLQA